MSVDEIGEPNHQGRLPRDARRDPGSEHRPRADRSPVRSHRGMEGALPRRVPAGGPRRRDRVLPAGEPVDRQPGAVPLLGEAALDQEHDAVLRALRGDDPRLRPWPVEPGVPLEQLRERLHRLLRRGDRAPRGEARGVAPAAHPEPQRSRRCGARSLRRLRHDVPGREAAWPALDRDRTGSRVPRRSRGLEYAGRPGLEGRTRGRWRGSDAPARVVTRARSRPRTASRRRRRRRARGRPA